MVCLRFMTRQLLLLLIFNALIIAKSFSYARQVKEVAAVAKQNEFVVNGNMNSIRTSPKEIVGAVPSVAEVKTFVKIGRGRKVKNEKRKTLRKAETTILGRKSMKDVAANAVHSVGKMRKKISTSEENWKMNFMAFSADYRSPKSHPPRNNRR